MPSETTYRDKIDALSSLIRRTFLRRNLWGSRPVCSLVLQTVFSLALVATNRAKNTPEVDKTMRNLAAPDGRQAWITTWMETC